MRGWPLALAVLVLSRQAPASGFAYVPFSEIEQRAALAAQPAPEPALVDASREWFRPEKTYRSRIAAVSAMMNCEARLLGTGIAVFEKKVVAVDDGYAFELRYFAAAPRKRYTAHARFPSEVQALNAGMGAEANLLRTNIPVLTTEVVRMPHDLYSYALVYLADRDPETFIPGKQYATAVAAGNGMYNTESRLLAGKLGVIEKRLTAAGSGRYSFEIRYILGPR